jgi:hypothetical protein
MSLSCYKFLACSLVDLHDTQIVNTQVIQAFSSLQLRNCMTNHQGDRTKYEKFLKFAKIWMVSYSLNTHNQTVYECIMRIHTMQFCSQ